MVDDSTAIFSFRLLSAHTVLVGLALKCVENKASMWNEKYSLGGISCLHLEPNRPWKHGYRVLKESTLY